MSELRDLYDRPSVYARAEPDDYDSKPEPLDPYVEEKDLDDEDELDEDEI